MRWEWVMHHGADPALAQPRLQAIALGRPYDIQMVDMALVEQIGQYQAGTRQQFVVAPCNRAAALVPLPEVAQLDMQQRRLDLVEPRVDAARVGGVVALLP